MYDELVKDLRGNHDRYFARDMQAADAIEELSKPKWIPVTERLPEECDLYLCWYEYYHVSKNKILPEYGIGYYDSEMHFWGGEVRNGRGAKVIAWMPLPQPPKGE